MGELWRRLVAFFHRGRMARDLEEEMQFHIEMRTEANRESGMDAGEARDAARRAFGNSTLVREKSWETWGWALLDELGRNLRHAARVMRRRPALAAVAIGSLALGIGANTAVFSFVRAVVLNRLPVAGPDRLVILRQRNEMFHMENCCFTYPFFRELRKQRAGFDDVLAVRPVEVDFSDREQSERVSTELVSGNYFRMLGVRPAAGRLLDESDDQAEGAGRVCVISHRFWQERYGGQADVIGRRVLINREPFHIVGISERGFAGASLHSPGDLQIPASMTGAILGDGRDLAGWAVLIARLSPGVSREQAQARLNVIGRRVQTATGLEMGEHDDFLLRDGSQGISSRKEQLGRPVLLLQLLVGIVLLVACGNLALLLLMRSVERTREAGLRLALGAGRLALVRQFLTESLLLAGLGGAAGWLVGRLLTGRLLSLLGPQGEGLLREVRPDAMTVVFSFAITLATGILFGALPAWRAARTDPLPAIRGLGGGTIARRFSTSSTLVTGQIAASLVLLLGAGLLVQTLRNLRSIDLGLQPQNVALVRIDLSHTAYADKPAGPLFEELLGRARMLPQTRTASLSTMSVLSGSMAAIVVHVPGYTSPNQMGSVTYYSTISGGYFRTLGIPLLAGRDFTGQDRGTGEGVAIVNERFAREFFAGDALGRSFSYGGGRKVRIIGIAGNARFQSLREELKPVMYLPVSQGTYPQQLFLQMRTTGAPMLDRLRALVKELDPRVPIDSISTMELEIDRTLARERLLTFLSTLLGGSSIALAAIGLYGLLSFRIARRTHEIGIRMALGAQRGAVLRMVLRETSLLVGGGIAVGIPAALVVTRYMRALLYGLEPHDPAMFAIVLVLLSAIAAIAAALPALRAIRIDPTEALRYE